MNKLQLVSELKERGCTVIPNVLSHDDVIKAKSLFWDKLESINPKINRNNITTWSDDNWPGNLENGFMMSYGIAQSDAAWFVRSHPNVKKVFSEIWDTSELLVSMDLIICWRPWEDDYLDGIYSDSDDGNDSSDNNSRKNKPTLYRKPITGGLHVDQSPFRRGFKCIQGMVVLNEVDEKSGGLQLIPNTHTNKIQSHIQTNYPWYKNSDYCPLDKDDIIFKLFEPQLIKCKPGSMILWDSRLVHDGFVGEGYLNNGNVSDLARIAFPVCMMPKAVADTVDLKVRHATFLEGRATTHWPIKCQKHPVGNSNGKNIKNYNYEPPVLTKEQLELIY